MRDFPRFVEFELTNKCQLKCIMCPHHMMKREQGVMDVALFKKGVDECRGIVERSYLHQIGEALFHPSLIECINYAADAGIRTALGTNCLLLDEFKTEQILNSQLAEIILAIDSIDPKNYEKIRRNSSFDVMIKNVNYFLKRKQKKKSKIFVRAQIINMIENKNEINEFIRRFTHPSVNHIWVKDYSNFAGRVKKGENPPSRKEGCPKPHLHTTIQWNGDMVICCRDYEGISKMGNIKNSTIREIWNSQKYNDFRARYKESRLCKEC